MSSFISQNLTEIEAVTGCTFARIYRSVSRMFSCLQINWQPFCLRQLLKFHPFDWLIKIYLQNEGQGAHHKIVSLQPMPGCPLCHIVFRMFSCLQTNWQPFYFCQLLKFHPFDWLIEIYLQTECQGTHHKMVSLQPMPGFSHNGSTSYKYHFDTGLFYDKIYS